MADSQDLLQNRLLQEIAARSSVSNELTPSKAEELSAITEVKKRQLSAFSQRRNREINGLVASAASGAGTLVEGIGTLYGLATGDTDNALREMGASAAEYWRDRKPVTLVAEEADRSREVAAADGQLAQFGTAFWKTVSNPTLFSSLIAEQLPNLVGAGGTGRLAGAAAKLLQGGEKAIATTATAGAVGSSSALHGADVAGTALNELMALPQEMWEENPEFKLLRTQYGDEEAKRRISLGLTRKAFGQAAVASLATQALPAGALLEKSVAGVGKASGNVLTRTAKGIAGETLQEATEEGTGAAIGNLAVGEVDPTREVMDGVGEAAGIGAAGGAGLGGVGGVLSTDPDAEARKARRREERAAAREAAAEGRVDDLLDADSRAYNPVKAGQILAKQAKDETKSPEERQAAQKKLDDSIVTLQEKQQMLDKAVEVGDPELQAQRRKQLEQMKAQREQLASMPEVQEEDLAAFDAGIRQKEEAIKQGDAVSPEQFEQAKRWADKTRTGIDTLTKLRQTLVAESGATPEQTAADIEQATASEATPQRTEATDRVVRAMALSPESVSDSALASLQSRDDLTPVQREVVESSVALREQQAKTANQVSQDVQRGGNGFKGMSEYLQLAQIAVGQNNTELMAAQVEGLQSFYRSRRDKVRRVDQAIARAQETGKTQYVIPTGEGRWMTFDQKPAGFKRGVDGNLEISPKQLGGARKLRNVIAEDMALIEATGRQVKAAAALIEAPAAEQTAPPVDNAAPETVSGPAASEPAMATEADVGAVLGTETEAATETTPTPTPAEAEAVTEPTAPVQPAAEATVTASEAQPEATPETDTQAQTETETDPETDALVAALREKLVDDYDAVAEAKRTLSEEEMDDPNTNLIERYFEDTGRSDYRNAAPAPENEKQEQLLTDFGKFVEEFKAAFRQQVKEGTFSKGKYRIKDYLSYVIEDEQVLDELATSMAYAGFTYIGQEMASNGLNTNEAIKSMLGLDKEHNLSPETAQKLRTAGETLGRASQSIGRMAVEAHGWKLRKGAPDNHMAQLQNSLGLHTLAVMMRQGLLTLEAQNINEEGNLAGANENGYMQFVRPVRDGKSTAEQLAPPVQKVRAIVESYAGTGRLLDKAFGAQSNETFPTLEPGSFKQTRFKNSGQKLMKKLADTLKAVSERPHKLRTPMVTAMGLLGDDLAKVGDYVDLDTEGDTFIHRTLRLSQMAKNAQMEREVRQLRDFIFEMSLTEDRTNTPFYYTPVAWRQQRVGLAQNVINPQTSKMHRHFVALQSQAVKVTPGGRNSRRFKLAVAQALGRKVDKKDHREVLKELDRLLDKNSTDADTVALRKAIDILKANIRNTTTEELGELDKARIIEATKVAGEAFHSLDGLVAWAEYELTQEDPKAKSFETSLMYEVDGVTNGPALAQILLGSYPADLTPEEFYERFGFFTEDSQHRNFNKWRSDSKGKNQDLYELTAGKMTELVRQIYTGTLPRKNERADWQVKADQKTLSGLGTLLGFSLNESGEVAWDKVRNYIKTPLTSMVFGAALPKTVDNMAGHVEETFYEELTAAANARDAARFRQVIEAMNTVMANKVEINGVKQTVPRLSVKTSFADGMNLTLSPLQRAALAQSFNFTMGMAIKRSLESTFSDFIETRKSLNEAANQSFRLFKLAFENEREKLLREKESRNEIWLTNRGNAIEARDGVRLRANQSLTAEDKRVLAQRLAKLMPVAHSALSREANRNGESASLDSGLTMSSRERKYLPDQERAYYTEVAAFPKNKGIQMEGDVERKGKPQYKLKTTAMSQEEVEPGVGTLIMLVHALDSAIASGSYAEFEALNIHDALGLSLNDMYDGAQKLNENTFKYLVEYSLPLEIVSGAQRTLEAFAEYTKENPVSPRELRNALGPAIDSDVESTIDGLLAAGRDFLQGLEQGAIRREQRKLNYLSKVTAVDQYAMEDGAFDTASEAGQAIMATLAKKQEDLAKRLEGMPFREPQPEVTEEQAQEEATPGKVPYSVWGELGRPMFRPSQELAETLARTPETTVKHLLRPLHNAIDEAVPQGMRGLYKELLKQIVKGPAANLPIRYITPDTAGTANEAQDFLTAAGAYINEGGERSILVKSPDFTYSNLTPELLLHELLHAHLDATVTHVEKKVQDPEYRSLRGAAVRTLQDLHAVAQEQLDDIFPEAVKDLHEFIAWGLTNADFQKALNSLPPVQDRTRGKHNRQGFAAFIRSIYDLVFGKHKPDVQEETALGIFLANSALLIQDTNNNYARHQERQRTVRKQELGSAAELTSEQLMDALRTGATEAEHQRLKGLMAKVVNTVYGPFGIHRGKYLRKAASTAEDTFLASLANGEMPYASESVGRLGLDNEQALVLESLEVTMQGALPNSPLLRKELRRVYEQARRRLTPEMLFNGDYATASDAEKARVKAEYDYLMTPTGDGDYLSRFLAAGLVYPALRDALGNLPAIEPQAPETTIKSKLQRLLNHALTTLQTLITRVPQGQRLPEQLETIARRVAEIEAKKQASVEAANDSTDNFIEHNARKLSDSARQKVSELAGRVTENSERRAEFRALGNLVKMAAEDRLGTFFDGVEKLANKRFKERQGIFSAMISEVKGPEAGMQLLARLSKKHEQDRRQYNEQMVELVNESFNELSEEEAVALTRVGLRTDLAQFADTMSASQLKDLLLNKQVRDNWIKEYEGQLQKDPHYGYYLYEARKTAYLMASGKAVKEGTLRNAHAISRLAGIENAKVDPVTADRAERILDPLITLLAVEYSDASQRNALGNLVARESDGVTATLKLHKAMQDRAKRTLFAGSPMHFVKGYVKDLLNNRTDVRIVSLDQKQTFERAGYSTVYALGPDKDRVLMTRKDGGLQPYLTGVMQTTGKRAEGSRLHTGLSANVNEDSPFDRAIHNKLKASLAQEQARALKMTGKQAQAFDPRRVGQPVVDGVHQAYNQPVPLLDDKGQVVNFRHMMQDTTKDTVMERNNHVADVLGSTVSNIFDKAHAEEINRTGLKALKQDADEGFVEDPEAYIQFGPDSQDPSIVEAYRLLPEQTKQDIRNIWGKAPVMVRKDHFDLFFGYRKKSITDVFNVPEAERTVAQAVLSRALLMVSKPFMDVASLSDDDVAKEMLASYNLRRAEDVWQEIVSEVKDIWVIKNLFTLIGNVMSNTTELIWAGVPIKDIIQSHTVALQGVLEYQRDHKELLRVRYLLEANAAADPTGLQKRAVELETALAENPVRELIDAGLFQSIVEDVSQAEDPHSFKRRLVDTVDRKTQRVPQPLKNTAKVLYMAHDTQLYKLLNNATRYSDFMARYTLHQHMINRKNRPMSKEESLQFASDAFVNYDLPTHRSLQYVNDMGIVPFTKYYLRIQRVLWRLFREEPARGMAIMVGEQMFPAMSAVSESVFWDKLGGNVISHGALEYPGAVPEIITLKTLLAPFH